MLNKNYRNGAEDVAEVASDAFEGVGEKLHDTAEDLRANERKRHQLTKELITVAEEHEQRLLAVEYKLPSIDFGLVDSLPSEKRAFLGGIIRSIMLPNNECRRTADLIISRFGVEPLATIDNDQIGLLSQDVQRFCTYYLYLVLRKTDGNADTEASINSVLDEFLISNKEKRQIINSASSRLEQLELNFIKRLYLNAGVHIYIILTQTTSKKKADAFISSIESILYQNIGSKWNEKIHIVKVLAGDDETDAGVVKSFGLDDLIRLNMDTLPSSVRFLLATAQQHNKQIKHDEAIRITESYVKTNGIKGFLMRIPIIGNIYAAIEINQRVDKLITKICELYEIDTRKIKSEMEDGGSLDGKVKEAKKSLKPAEI